MESYRSFLGNQLSDLKRRGVSYRAIARRCQIASPNFLQQVVRSQRNLTEQTARKIADGLKLNASYRDYFLTLVQLDNTRDPGMRERIEKKVSKVISKINTATVNDRRLYRNWLPGLVFESSRLFGDSFTEDQLQRVNRHYATQPAIVRSISTLIKRDCFEQTDEGKLRRLADSICSGDDVSDENLRDNHLRFLDFAKQHVNDDLNEREYQGLTVAIPKDKIPELKDRIRALLDDLDANMTTEENTDQLFHIQVAAFKLTERDHSHE